MFGAFKRLFSKPAEPEQRSVPLAPTQLVKAAAPISPASAPLAPAAEVKHAPLPTPAVVPSTPAPQVPPAPAPDMGVLEGVIRIPLTTIIAGLPPNLATLAVSVSHGTFALPVKTALAQLASGAVKVTFGELRKGSPPGTFADNASQDQAIVSLPLPHILSSIDPALLGRRSGQRVTAVPDNVTSIFGKIRPISATSAVTPAASVAPEVEEPVPAASPPPPLSTPSSIPMPSAPEPGASAFTRQPVTPVLPKPLPKPPGSIPLPSVVPKPPGASPLPSLAPKSPVAPKAPTPSVMPFAAPKPPAIPLPAPPPLPVTPALPALPTMSQESLVVSISELMVSWPVPLREEIEKYQLGSASVSLPILKLEAAMKTGRVVFTWGEVCSWLKPAPAENLTAHRETSLDLPLKVLAPLFMARRTPGAAQKKVAITAQIPDLFTGAPKAAETQVFSPMTTMPAPVAAESTTPAPSAEVAATVSALGEVFGQPGKSEWSPQEITQHICSLKGVAGSVLAMGDGLLMAGQLPAPLRTETVAAFMPQIIGRVSQYAGEMQMGAVTSVVVAAGRGHCAIYKTGKLYLAVLGYPEEALPEAVLGKIASELARRNA